jgi:phage terminase large subunit
MEVSVSTLYLDIDKAVKENKRYIFLRGSSRSGKTYQTISYLVLYALQNPQTTITIVRDTLVSIRNSVLIDFQEVMNQMGLYSPDKFNKSEVIYRFDNGSMVRFLGADDNSGKLRGMKQDVVFINEITSVSQDAFLQLDIRTTGFMICDYNPSEQDDWYVYQMEEKDEAQLIISTYKQNPFLEKSVVKAIEDLKDIDPELYEIYALGKKVKPRETIFMNWSIVSEAPRYSKMLGIGLDWGYSSDPCACVLVLINEPDNILYVKELFYEQGLTTDDIAYKLDDTGVQKSFDLICDSSEPRMIDELKKRKWNKARGVKKEAGSVLFGITELKKYKIQIDATSTNLIDEMKNYKWFKDRSGRITSKTAGQDHLIDSMRYVVMEMSNKSKTKYSFM